MHQTYKKVSNSFFKKKKLRNHFQELSMSTTSIAFIVVRLIKNVNPRYNIVKLR